MLASERIEYIIKKVYSDKAVTISSVSEELNVTYPTIRKYFDQIVSSHTDIKRTHGGITLIQSEPFIATDSAELYDQRSVTNQEKKSEIAKKAIQFVKEKETILLDSSSTCFEFAKELASLPFRVTIITNGISTAQLLSQNTNLTVIVVSGILKKGSNTIMDEFNCQLLHQFNIDKYFFSATGLTLDKGFSEYNIREVRSKQDNINHANITIALIDSSKFERNSSSCFAVLEDVNYLITDNSLSRQLRLDYEKRINIIE